MNLTKSFNIEYLKQNIKKSRGLILLFLILVPLFTTLITIFSVNDEMFTRVVDKEEVAWVNLIGMYVIPFVLSFALFGYVYKKTSVDFVNSMPINRKAIFITNTIGGIILITIMQLITAIVLLICGSVCNHIIIFTELILDIFILMWTSYVFVFLATNLAMSISGTFLTQIALTMLILFLVPFCIDSYHGFSIREDYQFTNGEKEFIEYATVDENSCTMPYRVFRMLMTNYGDLYSTKVIIRMIVLGITYFLIGKYLFQRRKMEDTEESFSSTKLHLVVKALTVFPMIIILNLLDAELAFNIFVIALIIVYYFIFDFIVKRKVDFKVSIGCVVLTLLLSQGICIGVQTMKDNMPEKNLAKEEVKAVSIGNCYYYQDSVRNNSLEMDYYLENQDLIDCIYEIAYQGYTINQNNTQNQVYNYGRIVNLDVNFKTKTGKIINADIDILEEDFYKILDILKSDEKYYEILKNSFLEDGEIGIQNFLLEGEEKEKISTKIKSTIEKMSLADLYYMSSNNRYSIYKYYYKNHELIAKEIPISITDDIFEMAAESINKHSTDALNDYLKENENVSFYLQEFDESVLEDSDTFTSFLYTQKDIEDFIQKNTDETFDATKPYYVLRGNLGYYGDYIYFFTNKVDEIRELVKKEMNQMSSIQYEDVENVTYFQ